MKKLIYYVAFLMFSIAMHSQEKTISLSLQEAIDYALENSFSTKASKNNLAAAKKKVWETTTIGLPQIDAKIDYQNWLKQQINLIDINGDGIEEELIFGTKQNANAFVTVRQLIFDGSYLVGLQASKTYLKISELANQKTVLATREAVINAYGNVLVAAKSEEILKRNLLVLEKNLHDVTEIYNNGLNEEEDVEQLRITLGNLKSQLNSVKRMKDISYKLLNISLGNDINTTLILTDSLDSLTTSNIDLELLSKAFTLDNHVDYKIAENDRKSQKLLMRLEQSKALPSLSAFVNYGYSGFSNSFTFFNKDQRWFDSSLLGISLNIPIFSSFGRSSKTAQAKIALENADIRLEETKQRLNLQAAKAKSDYQLSIENYETASKNLALSERIENKQRIKFFEGISTSFELLQAQNQLYSQQQNYVQSMLDVIEKKASLENALNIFNN